MLFLLVFTPQFFAFYEPPSFLLDFAPVIHLDLTFLHLHELALILASLAAIDFFARKLFFIVPNEAVTKKREE